MNDRKDFARAALRNNWIALAIHGIIVAVTLVVIIFGLGIIWLFLSLPVGVFVYVYFARKWLQPLEEYNWLSVIAPAVVIGAVSVISVRFGSMTHLEHIYPEYYDWRAYVLMLGNINSAANNMMLLATSAIDAISVALIGVAPFYVDGATVDDPQPGWFFAIFIPSVLMYLGLCLKSRQSKKG